MNLSLKINDRVYSTDLKYLDAVDGVKRYQAAILPYVLVRVDEEVLGISFAVYNAFDVVGAGNIPKFSIKLDDYPEVVVENFRYLCGFRKYYGTRKDELQQSLIGYEVSSEVLDWGEPELKPMDYGKYITSYLDTGGRPMLGVRECNWVQDRSARIRYADQGLGLPIHIFESEWPHRAVLRSGYQMGFNTWSCKGDVSGIGMKVDGAHLSSQFLRAALLEGDRIYKDEVVHLGNYAAMHRYGLGSGQVREQGRCMTAALFGWYFSKDESLESMIRNALVRYRTHIDDVSSIAFGRKRDVTKGWYVPYWEYAYLVYALWQAEQFGFTEASIYLDAFLGVQNKLGVLCPYWLYLEDNVSIESGRYKMPEVISIREDSARVIGFVMEQRGYKSPWKLSELLSDTGKYPVKNSLDFRILAPLAIGPSKKEVMLSLVDELRGLIESL